MGAQPGHSVQFKLTMLRRLHIRDFAIIDTLELAFEQGFTVLSGETGAGKSILIDALGLLLGDRADAAQIRAGAERAELAAEFDLRDCPAAAARLREQDLVDPDEPEICRTRRVLGADGRGRAYINGTPVQVSALREIGELLIEIQGQHEHQRLTSASAQRALLDDFGAYPERLQAVAVAAAECDALERAIEQARAAGREAPERIAELRRHIGELEALNLQSGEYDALSEQHRRLANAGRLIQEGGQVMEALYGAEGALYDRLSAIKNLLAGLTPLHPDFGEPEQLLAAAQIQLQEAAGTLRRLLDRLDLDPARYAEIERRIEALHDVARKHRVRPPELPQHLESLRAALAAAEHAAEHVGALEQKRAIALRTYRTAADELTLARMKAAKQLAAKVSGVARELGMPQARLQVEVASAGRTRPSPHGDDEVRFDFSANPGQPPRPLAKVASGGELSRIGLAIQVVALSKEAAPTMIFDEVDAGIGGAVAEIVGAKLRALAQGSQILCVTHLPQVAAQGRHHLAITKEVSNNQTYTRVKPLDGESRCDELARMLGGVRITPQTHALAQDLLKRAGTG